MRSLGGLLRLAHVAGHAHRAGARTSMVPILEHEGPAGPGDVHSLETTTVRASYGHGDNDFCVVGCRTTPWYGAAGMPSTLPCTNARNSRLRPCFAEKLHLVTKNKPTNPCRLCPVEFCAVCVALVTTTRGCSSADRMTKAEATSRFVALCGAKQGPQGFVAEP